MVCMERRTKIYRIAAIGVFAALTFAGNKIEVPIPVAMRRSVPQKKESPSPANGPISEALTLSIAVASMFFC